MTSPTLAEADLAYVAALVDTFANLSLRKAGPAVLPNVAIHCPNAAMLTWLGTITGTKVVTTRRDYLRHGCATHCEEAHVHIRSTSGRWVLTGARATMLLAAIEPHVRFRAAEVAELIQVGLEAGHKGATVAAMAALGWPVPARWEQPELLAKR